MLSSLSSPSRGPDLAITVKLMSSQTRSRSGVIFFDELEDQYVSGPSRPRAYSEPTPLKFVWEPELDEYCHLRRAISLNFDDRVEDEEEQSAESPPPSDATFELPDPVDDTSPNDISDGQTPYIYTEADQRADWKAWQAGRPAAWEENGGVKPPSEYPLKWSCKDDCLCLYWRGEG